MKKQKPKKKPKSLQRSELRLSKIVEDFAEQASKKSVSIKILDHFKEQASKNIGGTFNLSMNDYRALNGQKPLVNEAGIPLREPRRPPPKTSAPKTSEFIEISTDDRGHFMFKDVKWPAVKEYPIEAGTIPKSPSTQEVVEKVQTTIYNNDYRGFSLHDDFNKLQKENEQLKTQLALIPPKKKTFFERFKEWIGKWGLP